MLVKRIFHLINTNCYLLLLIPTNPRLQVAAYPLNSDADEEGVSAGRNGEKSGRIGDGVVFSERILQQ